METLQETKPPKMRPKLRFVGAKPGTFIWLAIYIGMLLFVGFNWELYKQPREDDWWLELLYTGIYFVILGVFLFFRMEWKTKRQTFIYNIVLTVAAGFFSYYQIEMLGFNAIIKEEIQALFINWFLILIVYLLGYVITNRFRGAVIFGNVACFIFALVNHLVFLFRGTPFLPNDIYATQTAMSVLGQMSYEITPETFLGLLPFLLNFVIAGHMTYKKDTKKAHIIAKAGGTAVIALVLFLCICTDALLNCGTSISYWNTIKSGNANGVLMQFMIYIRKSQVEKPKDYDLELVESIQAEYMDIQENNDGAQKPNVIVIMNEAFSDLSVIRDFETNEEYFPFYNSLAENCIKGNMIASIKGGGTCNTEFEFLTSSSHAFLPASCLPYQQYIRSDMPSMAWIMKQADYEVMAAHPYYATGWRRSTVYPLLGFDRFDSLDEYPSYAKKGRLRLVTDYANYQYLIKQYEEKAEGESIFIFNVTMQNHSGYSTDYDFGTRITVDDYQEQEGSLNAEVYLSLMRQSDSAFKYLIEYFEKEEEPTIIVMFGDHQPGDMNDFLDWLSADLTDSLEDVSKLYTVPYIIWSNYDVEMDVEHTEYISANYLSSIVMDMAGVDLPAYNAFLLELREEYPVVSSKICMDAEGNYIDPKEALQQSELLRKYQLLQYNNLFDTKHRNAEFYYGYAKAE